jgi:hydrogenase expression/formation protein HypE
MTLPVGKLPPDLLAKVLSQAPILDGRVVLGPGIGLDCAVVELDDRLLVFKTDPITFASDEIGWYAVQVNANDIATSGAAPRWFMASLLLPEKDTTLALVETIFEQAYRACRELGISVIGGHTEITYGLDRPILAGTLIGEVEKGRLVTPRGLRPGDRLLLTKGVPIEALAILGRDLPDRLAGRLSPDEIEQARNFLYDPGISVTLDAQIAVRAGRVSGMHDPTEGGLYAAVWELAEASECALVIDPQAVPVPELARKVCATLGIDPLGAIASGALLFAAPPEDATHIRIALISAGIPCAEIGSVEDGSPGAWQVVGGVRSPLPRPERDEIARLFDQSAFP